MLRKNIYHPKPSPGNNVSTVQCIGVAIKPSAIPYRQQYTIRYSNPVANGNATSAIPNNTMPNW
jgi:hypothetical protein